MINNINKDKCLACGTCTEICTRDVLRWQAPDNKTPVITYPEDCQTCYNCEIMCPAGAIWVDPHQRKVVTCW